MTHSSKIVWTLVAAAALAFYLWIWPWMAFPPEEPEVIAAQWGQVEAEAGRFGPGRPASSRLVTATASLAGWPGSASQMPQTLTEPIAADGLELGARAALGEMLAWAEEGGGVGDDCPVVDRGGGASPIRLLALARLAIRSARGSDDPSLIAALRLGAELRRHGTALGAVAGFRIAADTVSFAQARGWAPGAAFHELRPTEAELQAFPARAMVCAYYRQTEVALAECEASVSGEALPWRLPWSVQRWCERERMMVQWFEGRRYGRAAAETDQRRFAAALALPMDMPASLVLRGQASDFSGAITQVTELLASYDAYLVSP